MASWRLFAAAAVILAACSRPPAPTAGELGADPAGADVAFVNRPGEWVHVAALPVPGKVTVVEFFAVWCPFCAEVGEQMSALAALEPRIAVRKIDIRDPATLVARANRIEALPHVVVFDADGRRRHELTGAAAREAARLARELLD